mmetsp:Transcript_1502/g.2870  ORF Transcript_1502/g.2870 Transcript_1502/m.2870 type:complete len:535 (-) Transcript_1502:364-1968(-)
MENVLKSLIPSFNKPIQYRSNATLEDRVDVISQYLSTDMSYWNLKRTLKEVIVNPTFKKEELGTVMQKLLQETNLSTAVRNAIYLYDKEAKSKARLPPSGPSPTIPVFSESIEAIEQARCQWDTRLRYELRSVASKQKRKLVQIRSFDDTKEEPEYLIRFVYTSEDLLETITAIDNSNSAHAPFKWGLIKAVIKTPSLPSLRATYKELKPDSRQIGVDDTLLGLEWFKQERLDAGEKLLQEAYIPTLKQYAKTGVPPSLRPRIWLAAMGVTIGQKEYLHFEQLLTQVQEWDLITDDLTRFDVQETADNDEFFVFEEVLDEMMLAFTRDPEVRTMCALAPNTAVLKAVPSKGLASRRSKDRLFIDAIPPCTIIPYHRQTMFAAPLCFLFPRADEAYFLFRAMYCRYFSRLHTISSEPNTILYLCAMFENLLQTRHPECFAHCVRIGVHPLSITFPWMFSAFAGWMEVEQVLLFWDRLIAFDSLELVALLACGIFLYRSKSVLSAQTVDEVQEIFREMCNLKVIPILQQFLFAPGK